MRTICHWLAPRGIGIWPLRASWTRNMTRAMKSKRSAPISKGLKLRSPRFTKRNARPHVSARPPRMRKSVGRYRIAVARPTDASLKSLWERASSRQSPQRLLVVAQQDPFAFEDGAGSVVEALGVLVPVQDDAVEAARLAGQGVAGQFAQEAVAEAFAAVLVGDVDVFEPERGFGDEARVGPGEDRVSD